MHFTTHDHIKQLEISESCVAAAYIYAVYSFFV